MHSIGYLTKAYAESFESLDRSTIEALEASGADWWQIVFQAVIPSTTTYLISWTFLRFEMNFTNVVAMGAAAGAAGIGFDLFMASSFYFDLGELGLITYFVLGFRDHPGNHRDKGKEESQGEYRGLRPRS